MALRASAAVVIVVLAGACASASEDATPWGPGGKADYYGNDDRMQILDAGDPRVLGWARSTAIIVNRHLLQSAGTGRIAASAPTLGDRHGLCSGERFADEPVFGFCSSYLVAPDLVATAGHCFKQTLCDDMSFVFDFYRGGASEELGAIPAGNVFHCSEVVARQWDGVLDYALVRLDRPVPGRTPFALQSSAPHVGARVALIGYPSGILAKVDLAGKVVRVEGGRIRTSVDSFPGHSGGVMIDLATGKAFGVHVEGSTPSYAGNGTCQRVVGCPQVTPDAATCWGAIETSVDAFSSCCGGGPAPVMPTSCVDRCGAAGAATGGSGCACDLACSDRGDCCADFTTTCHRGSDADACLGGGAPCNGSADCGDVMCACEVPNATTESFIVQGRCSFDGCADQQALCAQACEDMEPLDGQRFTLAWWQGVCESN